jgi:hypothetical protein
MIEPQARPDFERRHPRTSHEELRRHLIEADEDRYRLRNELASAVAPRSTQESRSSTTRRRAALGAGIVIITGLAGGLVWQMCPSSLRAGDRSIVRVQTVTVTPRLVASGTSEPKPVLLKAATASTPKRRPRSASIAGNRPAVPIKKVRNAPRPLSPGEFGRPRTAADDVQQ